MDHNCYPNLFYFNNFDSVFVLEESIRLPMKNIIHVFTGIIILLIIFFIIYTIGNTEIYLGDKLVAISIWSGIAFYISLNWKWEVEKWDK